MSLYNGKILHSYEYTQLPIDNNTIEQLNQLYSYEKVPLVKDKYPFFLLVTRIPILDETQEEVPDMIDEYELDVEYISINDDDNGQEEDYYDQGLDIIR